MEAGCLYFANHDEADGDAADDAADDAVGDAGISVKCENTIGRDSGSRHRIAKRRHDNDNDDDDE